MTPDAAGLMFSSLAYTTDEADAMALVRLAVQRGCSPDEARDALRIWHQIRSEDTTTIRSGL